MTRQHVALRMDKVDKAGAAPERLRLVAVAVRDSVDDEAVLEWAARTAQDPPGATDLHVVHAYVPVNIEGCSWEPVALAKDIRAANARMVVARALQHVRSTVPDVRVGGSAVRGAAADVLVELSAIIDLLVVGRDDPDRRGSTVARLARAARCPVVVIADDQPPSAPTAPVTVLVDTLEIPESAVSFGLAEAQRLGVSLVVAQCWSDRHEEGPATAELIASRQEILDAELTDWRRAGSIGVIGELLLDDSAEMLDRLRRTSRLVVTGPNARHLSALLAASGPSCPVAVIPPGR